MTKTFTFNGPLAALIYLLVILFTTVLYISFRHEKSFFVLVLIIINIAFVIPALLTSYFRRLKISEEAATLRTISNRWQLQLNQIKHFGVIRYRSFRFIYLSSSDQKPFLNPAAPVISSPETFVIQFRKKPWNWIQKCIAANQPGLLPQVEK